MTLIFKNLLIKPARVMISYIAYIGYLAKICFSILRAKRCDCLLLSCIELLMQLDLFVGLLCRSFAIVKHR
uniref:Putative ovule protein n=1 Tax=Solanum chacoense TaxID=4108 RepID=A0A0V0HHS9_SOLCH